MSGEAAVVAAGLVLFLAGVVACWCVGRKKP